MADIIQWTFSSVSVWWIIVSYQLPCYILLKLVGYFSPLICNAKSCAQSYALPQTISVHVTQALFV
jgi:hypothetical protein